MFQQSVTSQQANPYEQPGQASLIRCHADHEKGCCRLANAAAAALAVIPGDMISELR